MAEVYLKPDAKISIPDSAFEYARRMKERELEEEKIKSIGKKTSESTIQISESIE